MNRRVEEAVVVLRSEHAQSLAEIRREAEQAALADRERVARADARADRAEGRVEQLERELAATRELASQQAITDAFIDASGVMRMVMRGGATLSVQIAELPSLLAGIVSDQMRDALLTLGAQIDSQVARGLMRLGDAPKWLQTAVYRAGAVVTCYNGRVYELRDGVAGSIAQEPGHHPEVWARIGSGGMRVMKAKPAAVEAGDLFADAEAHFISDGVTTTLISARPLKQKDMERLNNALDAKMEARFRSTAAEIGEARAAANDAISGVAPYQEWLAKRQQQLERVIARLDDLDNLFDGGTGT
jgi:hypothetical protein